MRYVANVSGLDVDVLCVVILKVIDTCGLCWLFRRCECGEVGPLKKVKGRVRRWHALSKELVRSPWKSPPIKIM